MSEPMEHTKPASTKEDPATLVLRGKPRPVVRFRRGLIVGVTGAVAATLVALSWFALEPPGKHMAVPTAAGEPAPTSAVPDALADVPKSYGEVPRLGPPLPGDLGRPILEHERSLGLAHNGPFRRGDGGSSAAENERERLAAARAAARSSPVLVQLGRSEGQRDMGPASMQPSSAPVPLGGGANVPVPGAGPQEKVAFARAKVGDMDLDRLHPPLSPFMLAAGTIIPASLITGLNSDVPGMVIAQVTENVRDSATGTRILVPQGARLIGSYDSIVAYGQRRALVVWNRIIFPDASSVDLDNVPATDSSGYAGLRDGVDSHTWQLIKGIALSTLLGVGTELSLGSSESDLVRAIRESAQQSAANSGAQITSRDLDVQPTITIRPGWPVRAILNKDLIVAPWKTQFP
jgi:type IV secretory pathway VirB10-like protein